MTLLAKSPNIEKAPLAARIGCWLQGGHDVYFNTEFGGLWCYRCGSAWEADPPVDNR